MSALRFAVEGRLAALSPEDRQRLIEREASVLPGLAPAVADIIDDVRVRGDEALLDMALRFDGARLEALEVPRGEFWRALEALPAGDRTALEAAADAIRRVHEAGRPEASEFEPRPGVRIGRRPDPLLRVGVYAPGGRAAYPSSLLMCVVPARVAGVGEIVACSPPGPGGRPTPALLAACALAEVDRLFAVGGAGAVAALAFGTPTIPRVDRIVGPGNAWVTEARRQLAGVLGRADFAGPSEVLVVCDGASSDARLVEIVAAELLAQAEHDPEASAVLVALDAGFVSAVREAMARRLAAAPRAAIVRTALERHGALLVADCRNEALDFASAFAPEHLALYVRDPREALASIRNAGSVVLGCSSSVVFGDYATGTNHVLPTAGRSRVDSGLSTDDFVRWTTWQEIGAEGARHLAAVAVPLAELEGLTAHAEAARLRAQTGDGVPEADGPIDLSDNRNHFTHHLKWALKPIDFTPCRIASYPHPFSWHLKEALAARLGIAPGNVVTGCGSDDLLDAALRAVLSPGDRVAFCAPTFSMIPRFVRSNRGVPEFVAPAPGFAPDVSGLLSTGAPVTYLARPNNPTGGSLPRAEARRLIEKCTGLVILDEAYVEFSEDEEALRPLEFDNVLVVRTFSKARGLAGLRIGYAVGPAPLIAAIEEARGPYKVSHPAEEMALRSLNEPEALVEGVRETRRLRARLTRELAARGLPPLPSEANFLCVPLPPEGPDPEELARRLARRGVLVRAIDDATSGLRALRITVAPWPMLARCLAALDSVLAEATPCA